MMCLPPEKDGGSEAGNESSICRSILSSCFCLASGVFLSVFADMGVLRCRPGIPASNEGNGSGRGRLPLLTGQAGEQAGKQADQADQDQIDRDQIVQDL